jgi:hypothetical protein
MERTNQRVSYTLTGVNGGYNCQFEVTKYDDASQFSMNGTMNKEELNYYCNYSVTNGNVNVNISGSESGAAEATAALKVIADEERALNGE